MKNKFGRFRAVRYNWVWLCFEYSNAENQCVRVEKYKILFENRFFFLLKKEGMFSKQANLSDLLSYKTKEEKNQAIKLFLFYQHQ